MSAVVKHFARSGTLPPRQTSLVFVDLAQLNAVAMFPSTLSAYGGSPASEACGQARAILERCGEAGRHYCDLKPAKLEWGEIPSAILVEDFAV